MKRLFDICLLFILLLISCGSHATRNSYMVVDKHPILIVKDLNEKLETAFQLSSTTELEQFFMEWNTSVSPNTAEFVKQDKVIESVYEVYKAFYTPFDLLKLGNWEWGNKLNSNCKYAVVQNKIYFAVAKERLFDKFDFKNLDSINDFRPLLNLTKEQVLYLLPEYEEALNNFLGAESTEVGENGIMNPSMANGDSEKRYKFIRPYIPVLHGHWGGYWHLVTHPEISYILLDTNLGTAKISFRVGYQGGEAILKKKTDKWIIEKSKATWIE